jgi:hypothetical protein
MPILDGRPNLNFFSHLLETQNKPLWLILLPNMRRICYLDVHITPLGVTILTVVTLELVSFWKRQ